MLQLYNYVYDAPYTHLDYDTLNDIIYKNFNKLIIDKIINLYLYYTIMNIDEIMLNSVFAYWTPTNAEKNIILVDATYILYNDLN